MSGDIEKIIYIISFYHATNPLSNRVQSVVSSTNVRLGVKPFKMFELHVVPTINSVMHMLLRNTNLV